MSKAMTYVNTAIGTSGFAVLSAGIAYRLMPDLWCDAIDASHDLGSKALPAKLNSVQGCTTYLVRFAEFESGLIKVLARSSDQLAQRINWLTGYTVRQLALASELVGTIDPSDIAPRKCSAPIPSDDLHIGVVTAEPGRRCTDCAHAPDGLGCGNFNVSRLTAPQINVLRRCKGFKPRYGSYDDRGASQLWPELWTLTAATK